MESTDLPGSTRPELAKAPSPRAAYLRSRSWLLGELLGAAISAGIALGAAAVVLRLWRAHLNVPISSSGDAMLSLMVVKTMQTTGWYQTTPDLGAPFGQNLAAYPFSVGDLWHMVMLKALSTVLSPGATVNVFFVLGFPVIAAVAYGCLRLLGVSRPFSCALGVVYALLPYHFLRGESHLLLGSYYALPIACVLAVSLYDGRLTFPTNPRRLPKAAWAALAGALLLAGTGLYYAAFTMVLLAAAGGLASLARRSWRPVLSGAVLIAVMGVGLVLAALPNLLHEAPAGSLTAVEGRSYGATEFYGLKITNLLLPLGNHRIPALAHLRDAMADSPIPGEGSETLGILGVIGLVAVVLAVLMPVLRRQTDLVLRLRPLGALAVVAILTSTVAGLNSVLAVFGFAELRAWNRSSVLIGFLALAGLGYLLDAGRARWAGAKQVWPRVVVVGTAGLVALVGAYDQTTPTMAPDIAGSTAIWNSDAGYFAQVEAQLGAGALVFTLPYARFPENPPIYAMTDYSHLRGYLHSDLRWSYGGVKNEQSEWQPVALQDGTVAAVPKLVAAEFDAIYVNRTGYADAGTSVEAEIVSVIGPQVPLLNPGGTLAVYDLRPYKAHLESVGAPLPTRESVLYPVQAVFGAGFYGEETDGTNRWRWAEGSAALTLANPSQATAEVVLRGSVRVADAGASISIRVGDEETRVTPVAGLATFEIRTKVDSGGTPMVFTTDSAPTPSTPADLRDLRQQVLDLTIEPAGTGS